MSEFISNATLEAERNTGLLHDIRLQALAEPIAESAEIHPIKIVILGA